MSDINIRDLRTIKGLGPRKAQVIKEVLDARPDGEVTADDLASIQGVSPRMAKAVVKLVKSGSSEAAEKEAAIKPGSTRSKTNKTKKTNGAKTVANGHIDVKAGDVRVFARQAEEFGFSTLANELRSIAAAKLDDETVSVPR